MWWNSPFDYNYGLHSDFLDDLSLLDGFQSFYWIPRYSKHGVRHQNQASKCNIDQDIIKNMILTKLVAAILDFKMADINEINLMYFFGKFGIVNMGLDTKIKFLHLILAKL